MMFFLPCHIGGAIRVARDVFSYYMRSYLESQTPQNHRVVNTVTSSLNRSFLTHYVLADVGFLASVPMKHDAPRELTYLYLGKK